MKNGVGHIFGILLMSADWCV